MKKEQIEVQEVSWKLMKKKQGIRSTGSVSYLTVRG